jgi:diguanylate cyclase
MERLAVATARARPRWRARRWFALACLAAGLVSAGFLVLLLVSKPGDPVDGVVDDVGSLATALLASVGCGAAAWRHRGHLRAAWVLLALGALGWAAGEGIWAWLEIVQKHQNPFPSLADAAYLGAVPLFAAGILLLRPTSESMRSRLRSIADGVIIAVSLFTVSWVTVLGAVWSAGGDSPLTLGLSVAYPASDVLLLSMLVFLTMRIPGGGRLPVLLLIAGIGTQALADSGFAYLSAANIYGPSNLIDVGYWVGYLLIALAGLHAAISPIPAIRTAAAYGRITLMLPYAPATAALGLAIWVEFDHGLDRFLFTCLAILIGAVLLRQFLALSDNALLVRRLANRENQLRHQADHDPLTGLANRARLRRAIDAQLAAADRTPCALLFIDVDDLKPINDLHGHAGGDAVLCAVAARLADSVRGRDVAARIGGDEFAILLPDLSAADQAGDVADRIIASMATPLPIRGGWTVEVSVSIGIATADGNSHLRGEDLISRADVAMYAAKASSKGIAVQWSPMLASASKYSESCTNELERAVTEPAIPPTHATMRLRSPTPSPSES